MKTYYESRQTFSRIFFLVFMILSSSTIHSQYINDFLIRPDVRWKSLEDLQVKQMAIKVDTKENKTWKKQDS